MPNEDRGNNFWRNVATGVGVAAAGAVLTYFVSEALNSATEQASNNRSRSPRPRRSSPRSSEYSRSSEYPHASEYSHSSEYPRSSEYSHSSEYPRSSEYQTSSNTGSRKKELYSELRETISEKLNNGTYECAICLEEISKLAEIMPCKVCHQICHINCLRKLFSHARDEGRNPICPTCRNDMPFNLTYKCFCEKVSKPAPMDGLTPHSCGLICGKSNCPLICHPGPCN